MKLLGQDEFRTGHAFYRISRVGGFRKGREVLGFKLAQLLGKITNDESLFFNTGL